MEMRENTIAYELVRNNGTSTEVDVCGVKFCRGNFGVIAGPCSIESEEHIMKLAEEIKKAGASLLRGGAFKMRTSPYDFQGLGVRGLDYLVRAGRSVGLPTVSEIVDVRDLDYYSDIDMIQVGARNMKNYTLLKELGRSDKPVLLKRGMDSTYNEFLLAAEYIVKEGNGNVVLCERGIKSFETYTRNTLDIVAVPVLHKLTHLPVIVDPSHATGKSELIEPASLAAAAAGADGLIIEVHSNPEEAWSDSEQAVTPERLREIVDKSNKISTVLK